MVDGYPGEPVSIAGTTVSQPSSAEPPADLAYGAFATVDDLARRWHALTSAEQGKAEALLDDASDLIRSTCPLWTNASTATLKRVCCAAAKRAMLSGDDTAGISQHTETAGSYSESYSYSNPAGDLYLTASEQSALGGTGAAWSYDLSDGGVR